jgi:glutamate-1-semialdehyde 2,1-aminomutase
VTAASQHGSSEEAVYRQRTPRSRERYARARDWLPGGDSRSPLFHAPYPAILAEGHGCHVSDLDGNALLDFSGNHTSLALGYGDADVLAAVGDQLRAGTCFAAPTEAQLELAAHLCARIPSLERVRFTNSGTEAVLNALRAARAFTGRPRLAKIEGGYNGCFDDVLVSTSPPADRVGRPECPTAVPGSLGLGPAAVASALVLPFNDAAAARALLEAHGDELAAVIVEPVMGSAGMIPAEPGYLDALREVTRELGILLVFDEVVSFRVARGGAQAHYGVAPDLTCLGKAVGGGFPLGVLGGRAEVMALFDPAREGGPRVPHPGSYNANPVSLVAGRATLQRLGEEEIATLNRRGAQLRARLARAFAAADLPAQVTGLGSLFAIHLTDRPVRDWRGALTADAALRRRLFLALFNHGVLIDPRAVGCVSLAVSDTEIDAFVDAVEAVAPRLSEAGPTRVGDHAPA